MKIIIAGGRNYSFTKIDYRKLALFAQQHNITEVVSGCANGADTYGQLWASNRGIQVKQFPADWEKYGKGAGFIRNLEMADYADALIAFAGGSGTEHMVKEARRRKLMIFDWRDGGLL